MKGVPFFAWVCDCFVDDGLDPGPAGFVLEVVIEGYVALRLVILSSVVQPLLALADDVVDPVCQVYWAEALVGVVFP